MKRTWVYTSGGRPLPEPYEAGSDFVNRVSSTGDLGKFEYETRMTDGTPISSRSDYKNYLKSTGCVPASEFKETWANRPQEQARQEAAERRERRETLGRTMYELRSKRRR